MPPRPGVRVVFLGPNRNLFSVFFRWVSSKETVGELYQKIGGVRIHTPWHLITNQVPLHIFLFPPFPLDLEEVSPSWHVGTWEFGVPSFSIFLVRVNTWLGIRSRSFKSGIYRGYLHKFEMSSYGREGRIPIYLSRSFREGDLRITKGLTSIVHSHFNVFLFYHFTPVNCYKI